MNCKLAKNLIYLASEFDKQLDYDGKILECAKLVVNNQNKDGIITLREVISRAVNNSYSNKIKKLANDLDEALIFYIGYVNVLNICNKDNESIDNNSNKTLEQLLEELNDLIGLVKVKNKVNDLISYQKVQMLRRKRGFINESSTLHMAFIGNPGTGKTTVARVIGNMYKKLGLLSKGHFLEVSRTDLIAGYQGQTALKVKEVVEKAKGGVLFIDEAYSITENENSDSYGRECLTELTKALEDYRNDLVVIVAGYTKPMEQFFESNPGLKSRFNIFIEFDDYTSYELLEILNLMCKRNSYIIEPDLSDKIEQYFDNIIKNKNNDFSNGRFARNVFDDLVINQAKRVGNYKDPTDDDLKILKVEDFNFKYHNK